MDSGSYADTRFPIRWANVGFLSNARQPVSIMLSNLRYFIDIVILLQVDDQRNYLDVRFHSPCLISSVFLYVVAAFWFYVSCPCFYWPQSEEQIEIQELIQLYSSFFHHSCPVRKRNDPYSSRLVVIVTVSASVPGLTHLRRG